MVVCLDDDDVRAIFAHGTLLPRPRPSLVAHLYRVSEKTVRDIWTGRTWRHATGAPSLHPRRPPRPHRAPFADPFADDFRAYLALVAAQ